MSEIDPALNTSPTPAAFDMRAFAARYTLLNGKAHPDTDPIATSGGRKVLLRYVNAGVQYHSMGVLGAGQTFVALDGNPLTDARHYSAETIGPGQTADAVVVTPGADQSAQSLAVYDASMLLHNSDRGGSGGMYTSIDAAPDGSTDDVVGPVSRAVAFDGTTLTATADDTGHGDSAVSAAEYAVDVVGPAGTGTPMTGAFGAPTTQVSAGGVPRARLGAARRVRPLARRRGPLVLIGSGAGQRRGRRRAHHPRAAAHPPGQ